MIAVLLSLASAAAYGTSDFLGGRLSARIGPWRTAFAVQTLGGVVLLLLALVSGGHVPAAGIGWATLSGLGTGLGVAFLYRGLSAGRMGVVAPVSGVGAAVIPAVVGVATGDHPSALSWVGIVLALPAIYLVAREDSATAVAGARAGLVDGVLAGIGFGLGFTAMAQVGTGARLWPVAIQELAAAVVVLAAALLARASWRPTDRRALAGVVPGILGGIANVCFLAATHHGLLAITAIIASFYPAATVVLAVVLLRERIHRPQAVGLMLCAAAVALVAAA